MDIAYLGPRPDIGEYRLYGPRLDIGQIAYIQPRPVYGLIQALAPGLYIRIYRPGARAKGTRRQAAYVMLPDALYPSDDYHIPN